MLNLPTWYDFVDISSADPCEIARLPLEFFKGRVWSESASTITAINVIILLADDEAKIVMLLRILDGMAAVDFIH